MRVVYKIFTQSNTPGNFFMKIYNACIMDYQFVYIVAQQHPVRIQNTYRWRYENIEQLWKVKAVVSG